ncbi:MAG: intracellular protease/amidase [Thermoproteus sp.]
MAKGLIYVVDDVRGEYATVKSYLSSHGYDLSTAVGARDLNINYDIDLKNINNIDQIVKSFDIYVLIGGYKMYYFVTNKRPPAKKSEIAINTDQLADITKSFVEAGATVVTPFTTPAYLAKLGTLSGLKATVYPITELINILKINNAIYINKPIIKEKNIITIKDIKAISAKDLAQILREGA